MSTPEKNRPAVTEPQGTGEAALVQVRELLLGSFARETILRLERMERRSEETEAMLERRFEALHARLDALAATLSSDQRSALEELAFGLTDLADKLRRKTAQKAGVEGGGAG